MMIKLHILLKWNGVGDKLKEEKKINNNEDFRH